MMQTEALTDNHPINHFNKVVNKRESSSKKAKEKEKRIEANTGLNFFIIT